MCPYIGSACYSCLSPLPEGGVGVYMVLKKTSKDEVICNCFYMIQMLTYQYSCGKRLSRKYGEGI